MRRALRIAGWIILGLLALIAVRVLIMMLVQSQAR